MKHLLKFHAPVKQQKVSGMPEKNKLYTGEELFDYHHKKEEYAAQRQHDKEKKKKEREEKKRKREKEKNLQQEARKKRKLEQIEEKLMMVKKGELTCKLCTKQYRGVQGWWICDNCKKYRLCSEHCVDVANIEFHLKECK
jgi:hypothetical protein